MYQLILDDFKTNRYAVILPETTNDNGRVILPEEVVTTGTKAYCEDFLNEKNRRMEQTAKQVNALSNLAYVEKSVKGYEYQMWALKQKGVIK
jgi:hypothetical protein